MKSILKCGGTKKRLDVGQNTAFNGTIIRAFGHRLCVFRGDDARSLHWRCFDEASWVVTIAGGQLPIFDNDDPRMIWHNDRLYLSTNWVVGGSQMELREVRWADNRPQLTDVAKFTNRMPLWRGYVKPQTEKNWAPFSAEGNFYYIYSVDPHRVLKVDLASGKAEIDHATQLHRNHWPITGDMRLSAPPVRVSDGTFLCTLHTRDPATNGYYTGFYRFEGNPPFRILSMGRHPIFYPDDSEGVCDRSPGFRLLFIQGMEVDERANMVHLYGGDNDRSVVHLQIPLSKVLLSLTELEQ